METFVKKLFIIFFALFLVLPGIQFVFTPFPVPQLKENRTRLPFPGPPHSTVKRLVTDKQFMRELIVYFDDNFPLRDLLIMCSNQMKFELFGESEQVIVGRDGWLFDRRVITHDQRQLDMLSENELNRIVDRIRKLNNYLKMRGIYLLLVPVPWKNTVIDDVINEKYKRATPNIYDRFINKLRQSGQIGFIDVRSVFQSSNKPKETYFRTDAHWNYWGASLVAHEIVNRLGMVTGSGTVWQEQALNMPRAYYSGAEAQSMGLLRPPTEYSYKEYSYDVDAKDIHCTKPSEVVPEPYGAEYKENGNCSISLIPQTLMVGNSFNMYFEKLGIFQYFTHVFRLWDVFFFTKQEDLIPVGTKVVVSFPLFFVFHRACFMLPVFPLAVR